MTMPHKRTTHGALAAPLFGVGLLVLTACMDAPQVMRAGGDPIGPLADPVMVDTSLGTCFARTTTPAIIETVTEQVMVQPASVRSDGTVQSPAAFRTVTRQQIMRERREVEFETPCAAVMTPQLIASVHNGAINGRFDGRTATAIERFQTAQGDVQTSTLTLQTARTLGLVAQPRDTP
jgi:peptidoglycan hydrolase-like protein with peptidoglycan-binding domain